MFPDTAPIWAKRLEALCLWFEAILIGGGIGFIAWMVGHA